MLTHMLRNLNISISSFLNGVTFLQNLFELQNGQIYNYIVLFQCAFLLPTGFLKIISTSLNFS